MLPPITLAHDAKGLTLALREYGNKVQERAQVRALNRALTTVRAEAAREISQYYALKIGVVKDELRQQRASRGKLVARITVRGRPIPLIEFGARQTRRGVSVRVTRRRGVRPHTFIATMPGGHQGVFKRKGAKRLPIQELVGPSLPQAFAQKRIQGALRKVAVQRYRDTLKQELNRLRIKSTGAQG